jgi:hypothetical protein
MDSAHNIRPVPGHVPLFKPFSLSLQVSYLRFLRVPFKDTGIKMWHLNWLICVTVGRFWFSDSLRLLSKAGLRSFISFSVHKALFGKHGSQYEWHFNVFQRSLLCLQTVWTNRTRSESSQWECFSLSTLSVNIRYTTQPSPVG